jgi:hypothetical protein
MTEDLRDVYSKAVNAIIQAREENGLMLNGKVYSMVKDRVEAFRAYFGFAYGIDTSVDYTHGFTRGSMIVAVAKIIDNATGHIIASGHAMEWVGNGDIGTTAPIEACETSAIGRALAAFGLHGGEYASANEMEAVPRKKAAGQEVLNRDPSDERDQFKQAAYNNNVMAHVIGGNVPVLPKPPAMPDNYYVPDEHTAAWDNPGEIFQGIIDTLQKIDGMAMLGKYWSSLDVVKRRWETENPEWLAELKDNFTNRTSEIGRN